jgi:pimeloyl-ACP methyl ester carboxylesterase
MDTTDTIVTPEGRFTAEVAGPPDGPLVVMLHGFPQTRPTWRHQVPALARAGFRVIAPDQRGYSPGVRPAPTDLAAYRIERLVADVLDLAGAAVGGRAPRFHLVGHDWGGQVAWVLAAQHPERVLSLAVLSRPHPAAFLRAISEGTEVSAAALTRHHRAFQDPATATRLLENDAQRVRLGLASQGVPEAAIAEYLSVLGTHEALDSALAWYRANIARIPRDRPDRGADPLPVGRRRRDGWPTGRHGDGRFRERTVPHGDVRRRGALHHRPGSRCRHDAPARSPRRRLSTLTDRR